MFTGPGRLTAFARAARRTDLKENLKEATKSTPLGANAKSAKRHFQKRGV
jgi:hypothetical protein